MSKTEQDNAFIELYKVGELYNLFDELFKKTNYIIEDIPSSDLKKIPLIELRLSEIYTLYNSTRLFLSIEDDLQHYDFSSLLSFWNESYFQICKVIKTNDTNLSWMLERFNNYSYQHEKVEQMISHRIEHLKTITNAAD